jgi:NifU-like protein involved in Fe-S cluster formation
MAKSNLKVHEYFEKGYHRSRDYLPQSRGEIIRGNDKLLAQFFIDVKDNCIQFASYKCSTCVVLVAYCEFLAEIIIDLSLVEVEKITPSNLILAFPEVLPYRHDRAFLAVQALHSAIHNAKYDVSGNPELRRA